MRLRLPLARPFMGERTVLRGGYVGGKGWQRSRFKIQVAGCGRGRESTPILPARFRWDENYEPRSRPPRFTFERRGSLAFLKVRSPRNEDAKYLA